MNMLVSWNRGTPNIPKSSIGISTINHYKPSSYWGTHIYGNPHAIILQKDAKNWTPGDFLGRTLHLKFWSVLDVLKWSCSVLLRRLKMWKPLPMQRLSRPTMGRFPWNWNGYHWRFNQAKRWFIGISWDIVGIYYITIITYLCPTLLDKLVEMIFTCHWWVWW